jgi:clan AA aspartic protease (TIGR02281 family)
MQIAFILMALLSLPAATANSEDTATPINKYDETMSQYEKVYNYYLKDNPRKRAVDAQNQKVAAFNHKIENLNLAREDDAKEIEREANDVKTLGDGVKAMEAALNEKPDPRNTEAVDFYNVKVEKYNQLVARYKKTLEEYNANIKTYNEDESKRNKALDAEKAQLDAGDEQVKSFVKIIDAWFEEKKDEEFDRKFNVFFAGLMKALRKSPGDQDLQELISRARNLRHDIGEYAIQKEAQDDHGLIIVQADVCGEECHLILDTGAYRVTLSPELVSALGLENSLGAEVENTVAGGLTAKGRELKIPNIQVGDAVAKDVEAMQLAESTVGVDGLLGRSFLKLFIVTINDGKEPKVSLKKR